MRRHACQMFAKILRNSCAEIGCVARYSVPYRAQRWMQSAISPDQADHDNGDLGGGSVSQATIRRGIWDAVAALLLAVVVLAVPVRAAGTRR